MKHVVVPKAGVDYAAKQGSGNIADVNEIDLLAAGAFACFTNENVLVADDATALDDAAAAGFYFAWGVSTNDPAGGVETIRTPVILKNASLRCIKKNYDAPAYKIMRLGYSGSTGAINLPASLTPGNLVSMRVVRKDRVVPAYPLMDQGVETRPMISAVRAEMVITAAHTKDTLIAALVAKLNAHPDNDFFTASVAGTSGASTLAIVITGTVYGQNFELTSDDDLMYADKFTTQEIDFGTGTSDQVYAAEVESLLDEGDQSRGTPAGFMFRRPTQSVAGETYDCFAFTWQQVDTKIAGPGGTTIMTVTVFPPDGDGTSTDMDTVLASLGVTVEDGDAY